MGHELVDAEGHEYHINVGTRDLLTHLTAGWWPLLGLPDPMCGEDCKMLARVLENYCNLQEIADASTLRLIGWEKEDADSVLWLRRFAGFLRNSGGVKRQNG